MITETMELDFGQVHILSNILIAELKEGVLFNTENNAKLLEIGKEVFQNKPYGYISLRNNSYAVDPLVYKHAAGEKNLKAIAVVSKNELIKLNANNVERQFYKDPDSFAVFDSLDHAINWIQFRI